MKNIFNQALFLVLFLACWYLAALGLSCAIYPGRTCGNAIGEEFVRNTIFQIEPREIIFNLPEFAFSGKKKFFLLGSSSVHLGFRPDELRRFLPEHEIHNMAIGSTNITEMAEASGLAMQLIQPEMISRSVFVLGVSYNVFIDNGSRWDGGHSTLFTEATRYNLYKIREGRIVPAVDKKIIPYFVPVLRPFLLMNAFTRRLYYNINNVKTIIRKLSSGRKNFLKNDLKVITRQFFTGRRVGAGSYPEINEAYKKGELKMWDEYMNVEGGPLRNEQFEKLADLCRSIGESGAEAIIVDMPLPQWHRRASPHYADYRKKMSFYLGDLLKLKNVRYVDMSGRFEDSDFYDSIHPFPSVKKQWSEALGSFFGPAHRSN